MSTADKEVNNLHAARQTKTHMHAHTQKCLRRNGMQSVQVSYAYVFSINSLIIVSDHKQCTETTASKGAKHISNSGHDSIVTITNELLTRESGDPIPHSLCVMFALNTLISELRRRQTRSWREGCVELSQVSVGLARTSLGWINITLRLRKSLNLAN